MGDNWILGSQYKSFNEYVARTTAHRERVRRRWYVMDLVTLAALLGAIAGIVMHEVLR